MKANWKAWIVAGAVLASVSGTAVARDRVSINLSFGAPAPVYVAPPAPVYYAPPAYYAPAPVVYVAPPPGFVVNGKSVLRKRWFREYAHWHRYHRDWH
jgi:hypothetical protein